MKRMKSVVLGVALVAVTFAASAEVYQVYVKRIDKDLYRTSEGVYIETQYCYHYSYGEDAILKYEQYGYDNKIIWEDDSTCDVKRVFK